MKSIARNKYSY